MIVRVRWWIRDVAEYDCVEFDIPPVNFQSDMQHWRKVGVSVVDTLHDNGLDIEKYIIEIVGKRPIPRYPDISFN